MIRTIIVDDDKLSRDALQHLLKQHCKNISVIAEADSAKAVINEVNKHGPELAFLDIEMPGSDGFQFLEQLPEINFEIIFTTSRNDLALKAFRYAAIDYLTKPVKPQELKSAVTKVEEKLSSTLDKDKFRILLENLKITNNSNEQKIALPISDGLVFVKVKNIVRCEASEQYTYVYIKDQEKLLVSRILKEFETLLSDFSFFRVHHTHLINLEHIDKYIRIGGDHVVMEGGDKIPISRRRKDSFVKKLVEL
ncbi:MAG: response regulator transcription factor [Bacteroidetes bacterium]|nr:response regulator transcription factor [Bacteroidota bacterium]